MSKESKSKILKTFDRVNQKLQKKKFFFFDFGWKTVLLCEHIRSPQPNHNPTTCHGGIL